MRSAGILLGSTLGLVLGSGCGSTANPAGVSHGPGTPDGSVGVGGDSGVEGSGAHGGDGGTARDGGTATAGITDDGSVGDWPDGGQGMASAIFGAIAIGSTPAGHSVDVLAVDDTNLYWTDRGGGWVMYCPKNACTNITVLAENQGGPYGIAVDATNVYWANFNGGQVMKCAIGGCNGQPTALATGQNNPSLITTDGMNVYWTNAGATECTTGTCSGPTMTGAGGGVAQCAVGGCSDGPTVLASDTGDPAGIAVDATSVYWAGFTSGRVMTCAIGGCSGAPTVVASGQSAPYAVAVDGANVYWTNWGSDWNTTASDPATLMACAKGGCGNAPTTLSSGTFGQGFGIAADGAAVYWTDGHQVMKVPIAGSDGGTTAIELGYTPTFIAVDAVNVYWGNGTFAYVMKTPK